jgi:hypothetical protein
MKLQEQINRIQSMMGVITEIMIPTVNNPHENGNNNYVVVAQDNITNDFLLLIVELYEEKNEHTFSYFLQVFNENGEPITGRLYKRDDSFNYLPNEIKPSILPIVKKMTTQLVNRINPKIINRVSMEILNNNTIKRFDEITNLLQNELGYILIWEGKDDEGKSVWKFQKNENINHLTEDTLEYFYQFNSIRIKKQLIEAEKITNSLIKNNWVEHRKKDKI